MAYNIALQIIERHGLRHLTWLEEYGDMLKHVSILFIITLFLFSLSIIFDKGVRRKEIERSNR